MTHVQLRIGRELDVTGVMEQTTRWQSEGGGSGSAHHKDSIS